MLNSNQSDSGRELATLIGDCDHTLRQLDGLLQKYERLATDAPGSPRRLWDSMRFGTNEKDQLNVVRGKLNNHKTTISVFLEMVQLRHSGQVTAKLENQGGQLDVLLDKVDSIAQRITQRAGSVMTNYDDDDKVGFHALLYSCEFH